MTNDSKAAMDRLIALVRRELGAVSVRILDATSDPDEPAENVLYAVLPDQRRLAVAFAAPPPARDALERRLRMLTATFAQSLAEGPRSSARIPVAGSLHQELRALAVRANAVDAAVIDAHSPIVWGTGSQQHEAPDAPEAPDTSDKLALVDVSTARLVDSAPSSQAPLEAEPKDEAARELTEKAIDLVRDLPGLRALRKGGHLSRVVESAEVPDVPRVHAYARSFATIYVLVVVYDAPLDDIRAERAVRAVEDALPRIERFVLALPPLDPKPAPIAGVISLRRGRRR
jgi:hypothetical protein